MEPQIVTGTVSGLLEDTPPAQKPQVLLQVENFLKGQANPLAYLSVVYATFPSLRNTVWSEHAMQVQAEVELLLIQTASAELDAAHDARTEGNTHAIKPAELYRKYAAALRKIAQMSQDEDNHMLAGDVLNDLFLSQSLPSGELDSPDYIDSYTGEVIEDDEFDWQLGSLADIMQRVEMVSPMHDEMYRRATELKETLGWSQKDVDDFMRAQTMFDSMDDEEHFDDRGYVPPTLETDLQIDRSAFAIATPALAAFTRWRTETFESMKKKGAQGQTWKEAFLGRKEDSGEVTNLVNAIAEIASSYDITTASAIALKVMGEYGLTEDDLEGIGGFTANNRFYELNAYIAEWGDDVLELMQDGLPASIPTSEIERMDAETLEQLSAILPEKHHNPMQTRSYILAYVQAISANAALGEAENVAIAAWRKAMSPAGAKAYQDAWKASKNKSTAWRAFWGKCGPDVPRPQEHVRAVRGNFSGLVLTSGRKIDWRIAAIKLKNDELALTGEQKDKLKVMLTQKGLRNLPVMQYL